MPPLSGEPELSDNEIIVYDEETETRRRCEIEIEDYDEVELVEGLVLSTLSE